MFQQYAALQNIKCYNNLLSGSSCYWHIVKLIGTFLQCFIISSTQCPNRNVSAVFWLQDQSAVDSA